jgi:hypothetical protein
MKKKERDESLEIIIVSTSTATCTNTAGQPWSAPGFHLPLPASPSARRFFLGDPSTRSALAAFRNQGILANLPVGSDLSNCFARARLLSRSCKLKHRPTLTARSAPPPAEVISLCCYMIVLRDGSKSAWRGPSRPHIFETTIMRATAGPQRRPSCRARRCYATVCLARADVRLCCSLPFQ